MNPELQAKINAIAAKLKRAPELVEESLRRQAEEIGVSFAKLVERQFKSAR